MRVNVYAEELTHDVVGFNKKSDTGREFFAIRFLFHSSPKLHYRPGDDDRSGVTFWVPWTQQGGHNPSHLIELFQSAINVLRTMPQGPEQRDKHEELRRLYGASPMDVKQAERRGASPFPPRVFDAIEARGIAPGGCRRETPTGRQPSSPSYIDGRYYREAWQHAACLTIAEGGPGWEQPTDEDSAAMIAVRELRKQLVLERARAAELRMRLDAISQEAKKP